MKPVSNMKELNEKYRLSYDNYRKRQDKIYAEISRLEKKRDNQTWKQLRVLFKPIAERLKQELKATEIEWYGPFGLDCSQSIYFKKNDGSITDEGNVLGSITFINSGGGYAIRDENENTERYPNGSLGEMNGMNHPVIEFTEEHNFNWLLEWAKKQR